MMKKAIAIMGIHTGIGKTVCSAVLSEALGADYWKPIQAGNLDDSDSMQVRRLVSNTKCTVHPDGYRLSHPLSPHESARLDQVIIDPQSVKWPETQNLLLIETAGGVFSPMNDRWTMADFVSHYELPAVLVVQNYLGSINHSLLSIEAIRQRRIRLLGLIINGDRNEASESFIVSYAKVPLMAHFPLLASLASTEVRMAASKVKTQLLNYVSQNT